MCVLVAVARASSGSEVGSQSGMDGSVSVHARCIRIPTGGGGGVVLRSAMIFRVFAMCVRMCATDGPRVAERT